MSVDSPVGLLVMVDADAPVEASYVPEEGVLVLSPYQSHESAVSEVARAIPTMPLDEVKALVRRHLPDAQLLSALLPSQDPTPEPAPVESVPRRTALVVGILASIIALPLGAYGMSHSMADAGSIENLEKFAAQFGLKCWGGVEYDTVMRCVTNSDSARVTITKPEGVGQVMLIEHDHDSAMVVKMESTAAATSAVAHGLGRMLVGTNPTAVGPYVVTSTDPKEQTHLENMAATAAGLPALATIGLRGSPTLPVTRAGDRPVLRELGLIGGVQGDGPEAPAPKGPSRPGPRRPASQVPSPFAVVPSGSQQAPAPAPAPASDPVPSPSATQTPTADSTTVDAGPVPSL